MTYLKQHREQARMEGKGRGLLKTKINYRSFCFLGEWRRLIVCLLAYATHNGK